MPDTEGARLGALAFCRMTLVLSSNVFNLLTQSIPFKGRGNGLTDLPEHQSGEWKTPSLTLTVDCWVQPRVPQTVRPSHWNAN